MPTYDQILAQLALANAGTGISPDQAMAQQLVQQQPAGPTPVSSEPPDLTAVPLVPATAPAVPADIAAYQQSPGYQAAQTAPAPGDEGPGKPSLVSRLFKDPDAPVPQPVPPPGAIGENPDGSFITAPAPAATAAPAAPTGPTIAMSGAQPPHPVSPSTKVGAPAGPSAMEKEVNAATGQEAQGLKDQAAAGVAEGKENFTAQQGVTAQMQSLFQAQQDYQKKVQSHADDLMGKAEATLNQYQNATVDPQRWWNSRSTGQKILAATSMVIGSGLAAMKGTANASPVANAINQDIELQKEQIDRTGKSVGMLGELASKYSTLGLNSADSMKAAVSTLQTIGAQQATALTAKYAGPQAAAQMEQKLGQLGIGKLNAIAALKKSTAETAEANMRTATAAFQLQQMKAQAAALEAMGLPAGTDLKNLVHDADGNVGIAMSEDDKKGYLDESAAPEHLVQVVNDIRTLRKQGVRENQAALTTKSFELQQTLEAMAKNGTLSQRTAELVKQAAGDPAQYFGILPSSNIDNRLAALEMEGNTAIKTAEKRHGVRFLNRATIKERKR